ncbi:MAG: BA14K family protein, partial [Aestuariivirgaceae bacterium]
YRGGYRGGRSGLRRGSRFRRDGGFRRHSGLRRHRGIRRHHRHRRHGRRRGRIHVYGYGYPYGYPYYGYGYGYGYPSVALVSPYYSNGYRRSSYRRSCRSYGVGSGRWARCCSAKYRSFNRRTGKYLAYSGRYRACR